MFPITHHSPDKRGNLRGSIPKVMWGQQKCDFIPIIVVLKKSKKFQLHIGCDELKNTHQAFRHYD